jgi:hypothetical protein
MRATLLAALAFLLVGAAADDQPRMLFAVRTTHASGNSKQTYIEPIALFRRQSFGPDKVEFLKPPREKQVIDEYYTVGTKYAVMRSGVPSGTVTVLPSDNNTCQEITRLAERSGKAAAPWRAADAIAAASFEWPKRRASFRALSAAENLQMLGVIRRIFLLKAVPAAALDAIKSENVVAADLNGDGRIDFIGSFDVRDDRNTHNLFAVVMRDARGGLRADVIRYDRTLNSKDDAAARNWTLVDVEDFDGDGIDEIIVEGHGWEWSWYDIMKLKREADWEVVYSGGGSGC